MLYGSVLRRDFRPDSDVDLLVEFEPGHTPGLFTLGGIALELDALIGREVDLKTPGDFRRACVTRCWRLPNRSMPPTDQDRLRHMLDAARDATDFAAGKNRADLDRDHMLRRAN